jgi:acetyl esterase
MTVCRQAPFPTRFEEVDADPPDSALREETQRCLSGPHVVDMRAVIPAIDHALAGDLTDLIAFRNSFPVPPPSTTIPSVDETISGVPVRRYLPIDAPPSSLPLFLYIHGGGWVHQSVRDTDELSSAIATVLTAEVISVDYTLSPEASPGTALSQCYNVWKVTAPGRIAFVSGDSAGGNMAASLVFKIITEDPTAKLPDGVVLFYPVTDLTDTKSFSWERFARGYGLDADEMKAYIKAYTQDEEQRKLPVFSPVYGDFERFPPSLVITCQFDILRDQGRVLADKIRKAGQSVRYRCLQGTIHACLGRPGLDGARADVMGELKSFCDLVKQMLR